MSISPLWPPAPAASAPHLSAATSNGVLPASMVSSLPPTSLLPPSLVPHVSGQPSSEPSTVSSAASVDAGHGSSAVPAVASASPTSPSRAAVAGKAVSDPPLGKAAATVIPINDSTVSAAAMLMSIAATNAESSTSTAGSTSSSPAHTPATASSSAAHSSASSAVVPPAASALPLPAASSSTASLSLTSPAAKAPTLSSAFISSSFSALLSPRSPYHSFSPSPFLPTSLASPTLSSASLFSTSASLFSSSYSSLPSLTSTMPSPLIASIRPGPLTPATTSSLVSSLSSPAPKPKPAQPVSALDRFVSYLHPLLTTHPGSLAPSITLPQLRVLAGNNFHQLIALAVSVHFNPRRPYPGHAGKEEKLIICRNGWNALRNFISAEREKAWRAEMSGLSVREQRAYKKKRREDRRGEGEGENCRRKVANAAIREGRMAKFIDIANEYGINYSAFVKLGDEHSGRLRFRQMKAEQKDAAANALVNSSALISASNVNVAISSAMPSAGPMMANALPTTLAAVVNEQPVLAAPLTPTPAATASASPTVAASLSSASFAPAAAPQADVATPAASTALGTSSSAEPVGGKRKLEDDSSDGSGKRAKEDNRGAVSERMLQPTDDELSGLPLLSPMSDTAMIVQ